MVLDGNDATTMNNLEKHAPRFVVILCVDDDREALDLLIRDVDGFCRGLISVERLDSAEDTMVRAEELAELDALVPLVIADHNLQGASGADLLITLHGHPHFLRTRKVLLSGSSELDAINQALQVGALNGCMSKPWTNEYLDDMLSLQLTEYFIANAPDRIADVSTLLDITKVTRALAESEHERHLLDRRLMTVQRSFLSSIDVKDEDVEEAMIACIDRSLNKPPRATIPAGSTLFREGDRLNYIWILLSGQVQLSRVVDRKETIFHARTVGRVVGLLSLSLGRASHFDCRTQTEVTFIKLSLHDLDRALRQDPMLSVHFVTVLLRSLSRRNSRAVELQLEVNALSRTIARERDHLEKALDGVKRAQKLLVEREKMATLGQLVAGVAHELNNPVAAIRRCSDFLVEDIRMLGEGHPDGATMIDILKRSFEAAPLSTRAQRSCRKDLAAALGDEDLAKELVEIGILDRVTYEDHFHGLDEMAVRPRLEKLKHYYQLSSSIRNIRTCAERIQALVKSLRSYSQSDAEFTSEVDLHESLEDTILLFEHDLRGISVEKQYGDLPRIACNTGEIHQVWTNLLSNAIQAMGGKGHLRITTDQIDTGHIRTRITDNGPGIAPDNVERIFEINYTTRRGRADFGLGIGLPICRNIIQRHHGTLKVESQPGQTCFSVVLPVDQRKGELADEQ